MNRIFPNTLLSAMFALAGITANCQGHFRLYIENDLFGFKEPGDKYYTNGIKFEFINPRYRVPILDKIFPTTNNETSSNYAIAVGQNIYTASDITVSEIIPNDRPYAGWLYLNFRKFSNSLSASTRITSELTLGVIGPAALAGQVQTGVHKLINSDKPMGWHNQIKNNPGINYSIEIENALYDSRTNHMDIIWFINSDIGTVFDTFGLGSMVRISPFRVLSSYFESTFSKQTVVRKKREGAEGDNPVILDEQEVAITTSEVKKPSFYFFVRSSVKFIAYNALLQGGIFNGRDNARSISPNEIERMFLNFDVGMVIPLGYRFDIVLGQSFRTPEFNTASIQYWGFMNVIYNGRNFNAKTRR